MSTAPTTTIITNGPGFIEADARTILSQISTGAKMACGYHQPVALPDGVMFRVSAGARRHLKLIIKLQADDLYTVERVCLRRNLTCVSEAHETGLFNDQLSAAVIRLGDVAPHGEA